MARGEFAWALMGRFGTKWWVVFSVLVVGGLILAAILSSLIWILVSAMLVLIVFPMMVAFLYISYGLKQECYSNAMPHRVMISSEGIRLKVDVMPKVTDAEEEEIQEILPLRQYEIFFPKPTIGKYSVEKEGITVRTEPPMKGFVWLPYSSFSSMEEFQSVIDMMTGFGKN